MLRLLIAIPVYNEQKYVCRVLEKLRAVLDRVCRTCQICPELLVIDDGSTDKTPELLACRSDAKVIRHPTNLGYGQSLIEAFQFADAQGFDWVITMDCDEQHEPERIPDFVREIRTDRWDIISGSRYLQPRGDDDMPPGDRRSINAKITKMLNERLGLEHHRRVLRLQGPPRLGDAPAQAGRDRLRVPDAALAAGGVPRGCGSRRRRWS